MKKYLLTVIAVLLISSLLKKEDSITIMSTSCTMCIGETMTLAPNVGNGLTPFTYDWSSGETTDNIIVSTSGTYIVTTTDANNCEIVTTFDVLAEDCCDCYATISQVPNECELEVVVTGNNCSEYDFFSISKFEGAGCTGARCTPFPFVYNPVTGVYNFPLPGYDCLPNTPVSTAWNVWLQPKFTSSCPIRTSCVDVVCPDTCVCDYELYVTGDNGVPLPSTTCSIGATTSLGTYVNWDLEAWLDRDCTGGDTDTMIQDITYSRTFRMYISYSYYKTNTLDIILNSGTVTPPWATINSPSDLEVWLDANTTGVDWISTSSSVYHRVSINNTDGLDITATNLNASPSTTSATGDVIYTTPCGDTEIELSYTSNITYGFTSSNDIQLTYNSITINSCGSVDVTIDTSTPVINCDCP